MVNIARARSLAERFMVNSATIYRPSYAAAGSPTTGATVKCRVVTYNSAGPNALDTTGEATHTIHLPQGTDVKAGDEVLVGSVRFLVLSTNAGRSLDYDVQAACKREA